MPNHTENNLRQLIESIHQLFLQLASKLKFNQVSEKPMGDAKGKYDIWGKLGEFLEATPELSEKDLFHLQDEDIHKAHKNESLHRPSLQEGAELSELSRYYQSQVSEEMHPHMSEQMQRNTVDHINTALHLARKGDREGARLHIELSESAMHTASRFMSHEEYADFEKRVEGRLEHIIETGHEIPKTSS